MSSETLPSGGENPTSDKKKDYKVKTLQDSAELGVFTTGQAGKICKGYCSQQGIIRCYDADPSSPEYLKSFRVPGSRFRRIPKVELYKFMMNHGLPMDRFPGLSENGEVEIIIDEKTAESIARGEIPTEVAQQIADWTSVNRNASYRLLQKSADPIVQGSSDSDPETPIQESDAALVE
ncbi:hypothetical protein FJZ28_05125 [Candidatus Peregrinibacteria bacterium]|nr:hypothetical protein [Candidatus Peregrinibacteria bacterium]